MRPRAWRRRLVPGPPQPRSRPSRRQLPGRSQRWAVGRVTQQRLANALAEDPSLAAGCAKHPPLALVAVDALTRTKSSPPAVERQRVARPARRGHTREPRRLLLERIELDLNGTLRSARGAVRGAPVV